MALYKRKKELQDLKNEIDGLRQENRKLKNLLGTVAIGDEGGYSLSALLNILESANMGIVVINSGDSVIQLSQKCTEILGLKQPEKTTLQDMVLAILPEDRILFEKALSVVEDSGKPAKAELKIARADAEVREFRTVQMHMVRFRSGTETANPAVICLVTDITTHDKTRKDLLKAREKALDREKNKNMLLRYLSHEIRPPVNAIIGYSELLHIGNLSAEKRYDYIHIIKEQGIYLHMLADDMAEFTRLETGKVKINKSPCNIDLLLQEVLSLSNMHKTISNKTHLEIRTNPQDAGETLAYTDPGRLQQLIVNLVRHSINLTAKGSVEIGYQTSADKKITFYVRNSSTPSSKEQQKKKLSDEQTHPGIYDGSGFELTIAKNLVRLLGGRMWTETLPEQGLTHFFSIPHEEIPESFHETMPEEEFVLPPYNWKDKVILIVEDDDVNYKFLETVLQDTDVQLLRAVNGYQAVELCRSSIRIDLVLMDIKLPDLNGIEASRKIREFNREIPILAQSAFVMEDEKDMYLAAGINDHIDKPINIRDFFKKIDGFLKES